MNAIRLWLLRHLVAQLMTQGDQWTAMPSLFRMIRAAYRSEYFEDNEFTAQAVLQEWFDMSRNAS